MGEITTNWDTKPLTGVTVVTWGQSCPAGYSADGTVMEWPGKSEECGCQSGAKYKGKTQSSSTSSCNFNQTNASPSCVDSGGINSVSLAKWKGASLCFSRTGSVSGSTSRPLPPCSSGYHACGTGTYDADRAVCAPDTETSLKWPTSAASTGCPLTILTTDKSISNSVWDSSVASSSFTSGSSSAYQVGTFPGDPSGNYINEGIYAAAGSDVVKKQLPIVELISAFAQNGNNGPCYKGNDMRAFGGKSSASGKNLYPASCKTVDTRWVQYDTMSDSELLYENFALQSSCSSLSLSAADLTSTVNSPDYFTSGIKCGVPNPNAGGNGLTYPCNNGGNSGASCDAGDSRCFDAFFQSACGRLIHFAKSSNANKKVGLFYRNEIFWSGSCKYTKKSVADTNKTLNLAILAQTALLGINIVINGLLAVISVFLLYRVYKNATDNDESTTTDQVQQQEKTIVPKVQFVGRVLLLPPVIAALYYSNRVLDFYVSVSKAKCSDSMTNRAFDELAALLPEVISSDGVTLAFDLGQLILLPALMWIYHKHCAKKSPEEGAHVEVPMVELTGVALVVDDSHSQAQFQGQGQGHPHYHTEGGLSGSVSVSLHKHLLKGTQRPIGFTCDGRHQNGGCRSGGDGFGFPPSSFSWYCQECDFDLCANCAAESMSSDQAMPSHGIIAGVVAPHHVVDAHPPGAAPTEDFDFASEGEKNSAPHH